ncbi:MAG: response regulator transcription factor [Bacteroidales bacterium]|nr:response regulator transcription factor [Bacteroidales bacterium]MDD4670655.1 response regulator transcription factor [Bacteroidales bacterium]
MNILVVEDEKNISSFIERGLIEHGHTIEKAMDGESAWNLMQNNNADLIILDLVLPGIGGLDLCKSFRELFGYKTPIMMLTALGSLDDIVKGLNVGADDYLTKPFRFPELLARVNSLLRRNTQSTADTITFDDLVLDKKSRSVKRGDKIVPLTVKEYKLMELFMTNPNEVLSRSQILESVWDVKFDTLTNVVDVYVNFLRNKIDKNYDKKLIHTVVGVGYILKSE